MKPTHYTADALARAEERRARRLAPTRNSRAFIALCLEAAGHARRRGDKAKACDHLEAVYREVTASWGERV